MSERMVRTDCLVNKILLIITTFVFVKMSLSFDGLTNLFWYVSLILEVTE